jgi:uncharacterized protein YifN (PemK superfamily)
MNKRKYRVRNWSDYNKSLVRRGDLSIWLSEEMLDKWHFAGKRKPGGVKKFSDMAIKAGLIVKEIFRMSYRMCEGFVNSLLALFVKKELKSPHYTVLCRRAKTIDFKLTKMPSKSTKLHILIDSTGFHIYGEGEWQRTKHKKDKQRDWVKIHIAMDVKEQKILSMQVSDGRGYDANYLPPLLDDIKADIDSIYADGAYDKRKCYLKASAKDAQLIVPPQHNACEQKYNKNYENSPAYDIRDRAIRFIKEFSDEEQGRRAWKKVSGYHKRSLVETAMFRLKSIFGDVLRCKKFENQRIQLLTRCYILNKMTDLGMPQSVLVEV